MQVVDTTARRSLGPVEGLGDLSHASIVYSRDQRFGFVFGRDGGLTKVDLLDGRIVKRVVQAGNSIGGAISQDGTLVAVSNYEPGGVTVFHADTLELVSEIPAVYGDGSRRSKVVGLVDAPGRRFVFSLYDAGEIWIADGHRGGNNRIVEAVDADAVVFLNNDTRPDPGWLAALVDALDAAPSDVAAVSGLIVDWEAERLDFARGILTFDGHAFQEGSGREIAEVGGILSEVILYDPGSFQGGNEQEGAPPAEEA